MVGTIYQEPNAEPEHTFPVADKRITVRAEIITELSLETASPVNLRLLFWN